MMLSLESYQTSSIEQRGANQKIAIFEFNYNTARQKIDDWMTDSRRYKGHGRLCDRKSCCCLKTEEIELCKQKQVCL